MLRALMYILPIALTIYAFIDCLNTPEDEVRHLPKVAWVFIILLFWVVGPVVWLAAGRTRRAPAAGRPPGGRRPGRREWVAPDDNPEFLKSLHEGKAEDESRLKDWEADLRRREEELRRREQSDGGKGGGEGDPGRP
ncbi:PLD nuclease N-terminal domain-containing protein [Streptomyces somaliensis]|uniref:PLD nuclease N-terminal domain-containing protein n=1 Tax=Streptomyces somaliensis TaxID=78355 RepID=UPI0034E93A92|nr:PLD nuclease N-terminal domain-containing protein [Streptomyces somaliensis]MCP9974532.1 PLD nuclease N-terminal domain-containing protein [Streptomyces somaliensis]